MCFGSMTPLRWIDANKLLCTPSPVEIHPGTGGAVFDVAYPVVSQEG
jgi:hypothetical protein